MTASSPWCRFDDMRAGVGWVFPTPQQVVSTTELDHVVDVLRDVGEATCSGAWAFGYVSYEAAAGLDRALPGGWAPGQLPLVWFGLCDRPTGIPPIGAHAAARVSACPWRPDWSDQEYHQAVACVRDHIATGQTYQVNLTDRLRTRVTGDPLALYARLALAQHGAYNAYLDLGDHIIASASPELFFDWTGDTVRCRPMKGTARRGRTAEHDKHEARLLRASPKEQAENLMIVDLIRNDLGRIARTGSVTVRELFTLEQFPTVWQLTSEICARTRPGIGLPDLFAALFPCASVTGAPKHATMRIIEQLEPTARGVYCGAIGVLAPPSASFRARFSVAIRTVVVDSTTGEASYGAGGGITWDSDPARERAELHAKAAVLTHHDDLVKTS